MSKFVIPAVPEGMSVDVFFTQFIPEQFQLVKPLIDAVDVSFLQGKEYRVQSEIDEQLYTMVFRNGNELAVVKGNMPDSNLRFVLTEADWRYILGGMSSIEGGLPANPAELMTPKRYEAALSTKGTVNLNIKKEDGSILPFKVVFNGLSRPNVTINFDLADIINLVQNKISILSLFMGGRLKFTGDMLLLMRLQKFI